ncbi:transglycosylase domain-containing protein [Micromonospora sp. HM5-17]|jgi:membrane peptidoglycan carboxypeptidase|uniref:transglycosylase domain-containing protein n=1 Tax=Micromonospora sp. HM5-17 TaxID=2487710 RepID=UPI000F4665DE|nr:transglycosylase domain-containing protein [Micromonospora sp. HM5-17]ROT31589.1 penicillin-binding protein [Micromonospora sp. HM5-17]
MLRLRLNQLWTLTLAGLLAGTLLAAALLPASVLAAVGLQSVSARYEDLPQDLRVPPTAQRSYLYANDGRTLITSFYDENRTEIPFDQIALTLRQAVVAAEDSRFYEHGGVDLRGIVRAFVANQVSGTVRQGASTLTMQYVRNVLKSDPDLTPEQRAEAIAPKAGRKIQEMRYALALERRLSKDEILGRYLNIAYFGAGAYGVAAASQRYFSKPASALTLAESALLAGLLRSPETDSPIDGDSRAALARRGYVLGQMVRTGMISPETAARTQAEELRLNPGAEPNDCAGIPDERSDWGFFCDYFRRWWERNPAFGATPDERRQNLRRGGYRITTSLDPTMQAAALAQTLEVYDYTDRWAVPMAVVQPGTGRILALAVNRHYRLDPNPPGQRNYPNTVNQLIAGGGDIVGYQAGSTFKIFTMLAALEAGMPLNSGYDAPSRLVTRYPASGPDSCGGRWCPVNANPDWMDGYHTMWTAFGRSVNTYFVALAERIGAERVVRMAERLGIVFRAASDARLATYGAADWGAFTLGVSATTPLDLANAYATLAADGTYCQPLPVHAIVDPAGRSLPAAAPSCGQMISPEVARAATDAARCPVGNQSAYRRCDGAGAPEVTRILGDQPVAGKTGSAEGYATETFVAFTPQLAAAAIAVNPDDPGDAVGREAQPKVVAAVAHTLAAALRGQPRRDFTAPSRELAFGGSGGQPAPVPDVPDLPDPEPPPAGSGPTGEAPPTSPDAPGR